jgi:hypothetical protein
MMAPGCHIVLDGGRKGTARPHRSTQDDEVGTLYRIRCRSVQSIGKLQLRRRRQRLSTLGVTTDGLGTSIGPDGMRNRRTDQAKAQDGDFLERLRHDMKSLSAATTAWLASSSPTVRRKEPGKP